jgi:baculoviral IAP repeat-containing protein 7/8
MASLNFNHEIDRLESFTRQTTGIIANQCEKEDLAILGFYLLSPPHKVKCNFCSIIFDFEPGLTALGVHLKLSPNCPLLLRGETENVPIDASKLDRILPAVTYDTCGFGDEAIVKFPRYTMPAERLKTFDKWPEAKKPTAGELVQAGFFFVGPSDLVVCFSCGLGLDEWKHNDSPWGEHERHLIGECNFLRHNRCL